MDQLDLRDITITGILIADIVEIDRDYIQRHVTELGVLEEWQSIVRKLGEAQE